MKRAFLILSALCAPLAAVASSPAPHPAAHAHAHAGIPWATLLFSTVNFVLFLFVLKRYAWPGMRDWIDARRRRIIDEIQQASRAKQDAEELKAEWEDRTANLAAELEEMRRQARHETARERDRVLAEARAAAEAIRRDARRLAEQELRDARAALRQELARRAFQTAQRHASEKLTAADQDRFIADFIKQVQP